MSHPPASDASSEFLHILPHHETELCEKLYQQWQQKQLCDLVISVGSSEICAHSCIVAAFSPKLRIVLEEKHAQLENEFARQATGKSNTIFQLRQSLSLTFDAGVFKCLLNMMYTGVLSFNICMLAAVKATAEWMQMKEVVQLCQDYIDVTGYRPETISFTDEAVLFENLVLEVESVYETSSASRRLPTHIVVKQEVEEPERTVNESSKTKRKRQNAAGVSVSKPESANKRKRVRASGPKSRSKKTAVSDPPTIEIGGETTDAVPSSGKVPNRRKRGRPKKQPAKETKPTKYNTGVTPDMNCVKLEVDSDNEDGQIGELSTLPLSSDTTELSDGKDVPDVSSQTGEKQDETPQKKKRIRGPRKPRKTSAGPKRQKKKPTGFQDPEALVLAEADTEEAVDGLRTAELEFGLGKREFITCHRCSEVFSQAEADAYFAHMADHPFFECEQCHSRFYRKANFTRHMRFKHSDLSHLHCRLCELKATTEKELRTHFKEVHGDTKVFVCEEAGCNYTASRYYFLVTHLEIHLKVKKYKCPKCGESFSQSNGLTVHRRSCYDLKQYLCDLCGKGFNLLQSMQQHRMVHTGQKPYQCAKCPHQCSNPRNLKRHMLIHDNAFPFQCPVCKRRFRHSNSFKSHAQRHPDLDISASITQRQSELQRKRSTGRIKGQKSEMARVNAMATFADIFSASAHTHDTEDADDDGFQSSVRQSREMDSRSNVRDPGNVRSYVRDSGFESVGRDYSVLGSRGSSGGGGGGFLGLTQPLQHSTQKHMPSALHSTSAYGWPTSSELMHQLNSAVIPMNAASDFSASSASLLMGVHHPSTSAFAIQKGSSHNSTSQSDRQGDGFYGIH